MGGDGDALVLAEVAAVGERAVGPHVERQEVLAALWRLRQAPRLLASGAATSAASGATPAVDTVRVSSTTTAIP